MISELDRFFLERTYELAARGIGNTAPNPPVGAVVARGDRVLAEGFHHRAGEAHAEVNALKEAGDARGATLYVSLEPCKHAGRTPPCTSALLDAGIARVVAGARDPSTFGGGAAFLRERGIDVDVADDTNARALIEIFAATVQNERAYVALKMAMSLDGFVAPRPGVAEWMTGDEERVLVRELRYAHDAVMVGAGTIRVDDPQLTVRPPAQRLRPFMRVVACESAPVDPQSRVFAPVAGYARTIVLAPAGARAAFAELDRVAEVAYVGDSDAQELDLAAGLRALRERDVVSVLCEGGPTLARHLIDARLVDRFYWIVAPLLLANSSAVPVLATDAPEGLRRGVRFDACETLGSDVLLRGTFVDV